MTVYKKDNPVLIEKGIQEIQDILSLKLNWLDNIFGKVVKLSKPKDNAIINYPAFYLGDAEYINLLPDTNLGNYCFFEVYDPQVFENVLQDKISISLNGAIVFWYNQNTINSDSTHVYTEEIKYAILSALQTKGLTKSISMQILRIIEEPSSIFRNYSVKQIDSQFLMYPYFGIRIECSFKVQSLC